MENIAKVSGVKKRRLTLRRFTKINGSSVSLLQRRPFSGKIRSGDTLSRAPPGCPRLLKKRSPTHLLPHCRLAMPAHGFMLGVELVAFLLTSEMSFFLLTCLISKKFASSFYIDLVVRGLFIKRFEKNSRLH